MNSKTSSRRELKMGDWTLFWRGSRHSSDVTLECTSDGQIHPDRERTADMIVV